jgi:predicted  nucleic acid-binding Zn-ribbon protein
MNLFEIILVALLGVYVLSNLYFAISGRILAIKDRKEDLERRNKDEEYENQLNILTKRVGEVGTENHNLTMNLREYQTAYYQLKKENDELKKKFEESKKTTRKKKETEE